MIKRSSRREFRTGDLVKFDNPTLIPAQYRHPYENKVTGKRLRLKMHYIEGLQSQLPFAKILVQKRFVFYRSTANPSVTWFMLYDNYKPEILGRGWSFDTRNHDIFKRVGRVIDINKLPPNLIAHMKTDLLLDTFIPNKALGQRETIETLRSNRLHIFVKDPAIRYALLNIMGERCLHCGENLIDTKLEILFPDKLHMGRIKSKARKIMGYNQSAIAGVFPALFICGECKQATTLIFINRLLELAQIANVNVGNPESFIRK